MFVLWGIVANTSTLFVKSLLEYGVPSITEPFHLSPLYTMHPESLFPGSQS